MGDFPTDQFADWAGATWDRGKTPIKYLETLFQDVTMAMVGVLQYMTDWKAYKAAIDNGQTWPGEVPLNPYYFVRLAWPTKGAPAWKTDETIVFLLVAETDDPYNRLRETEIIDKDDSTVILKTKYTRVIGVRWVFYGPNSYDTAQTVRDSIFLSVFHDILASAGLFLVPDFAAPRRVPEQFQGQWWERVDLSMTFNQAVVIEQVVNFIASANIVINTDTGQTRTVEITSS